MHNYQKDMKKIIPELKRILKEKDTRSVAYLALLLDFQATLEAKPEKAMKLEKDALALFKEVTEENIRIP